MRTAVVLMAAGIVIAMLARGIVVDAPVPPAAASPAATVATVPAPAAQTARPATGPTRASQAATQGAGVGDGVVIASVLAPPKRTGGLVLMDSGSGVVVTPKTPGDPPGKPPAPPDPEPADRDSLPLSTSGPVYTWQDGDRTMQVQLQPNLTVQDDGEIVARSARLGRGARGIDDGQGSAGPPVFNSQSGSLMTLPGGVLLVLDSTWSPEQADAFFARNSIEKSHVSELGYLPNGFFIETEPGFPSLDLANALAGQEGVELSSPNWAREVTAQ